MKLKIACLCLLGGALFAAKKPSLNSYTEITYTVSGTLAPNLNSGPDCLMWNNQPITLVFSLAATENPISSTKNTATYLTDATVAAGGYSNDEISVDVTFTLTPDYNSITVRGTLQGLGPVIANLSFAPDSFDQQHGVPEHPEPLAKQYNPQTLQPPASYVEYAAPACSLTQLGIGGTLATATS
jgi:hypothetical protein